MKPTMFFSLFLLLSSAAFAFDSPGVFEVQPPPADEVTPIRDAAGQVVGATIANGLVVMPAHADSRGELVPDAVNTGIFVNANVLVRDRNGAVYVIYVPDMPPTLGD